MLSVQYHSCITFEKNYDIHPFKQKLHHLFDITMILNGALGGLVTVMADPYLMTCKRLCWLVLSV